MRGWSGSGTAPARSSGTSSPGHCCGHMERDVTPQPEPVRAVAEGQVLVITIDRPPANAIDTSTSRALYAAFDRLRRDPLLRVGIVTGRETGSSARAGT